MKPDPAPPHFAGSVRSHRIARGIRRRNLAQGKCAAAGDRRQKCAKSQDAFLIAVAASKLSTRSP